MNKFFEWIENERCNEKSKLTEEMLLIVKEKYLELGEGCRQECDVVSGLEAKIEVLKDSLQEKFSNSNEMKSVDIKIDGPHVIEIATGISGHTYVDNEQNIEVNILKCDPPMIKNPDCIELEKKNAELKSNNEYLQRMIEHGHRLLNQANVIMAQGQSDDTLFINHIQKHLDELHISGDVVCKICGKTAKEICQREDFKNSDSELKVENARLKEEIRKFIDGNVKRLFVDDNRRLTAENARLKEELKEFTEYAISYHSREGPVSGMTDEMIERILGVWGIDDDESEFDQRITDMFFDEISRRKKVKAGK